MEMALMIMPMMEGELCDEEMGGSLWSLKEGSFMGVLGWVFPEDKDLGGGLKKH